MNNAIGNVHMLALSVGRRIVMLQIIKEEEIQVFDKVEFKGKKHEIISVYSEASPLCGYVLLSGIGSPILVTDITKL